MVEDQHQTISSALRLGRELGELRFVALAECGRDLGRVLPDAGGVALADAAEEGLHLVEAGSIAERGIDDLRERTGAGAAPSTAAPKSDW